MNSRTLGLTLNVLTGAALSAALVVPAITNDSPLGGFVGSGRTSTSPPNVPHWQPAYTKRFPGCGPKKVLGDVVVMGQDASLHRMSFDAAWNLVHNVNPADDVWVVGWCR